VRRMINERYGKSRSRKSDKRVRKELSVDSLVREYQEHTRQQQELVIRARTVHERLLVLVTSMSRLLTDEHFATLLRAEKLDALPAVLVTSN
ncbi:MAG: hypothetical protein WA634_10230, partial [Silvibacterium sp.]